MDWFEQLPKVELHVHLEGAIPPAALLDLVCKYGGDPDVPDVAALARRFEYRDFAQFIAAWSWKNRFLRELEDFTHIAELVARDMAGQNIRYAEMFVSPSLFVPRGLAVQRLVAAVRTGLARVPEIEIGLIADLVRDYGPDAEIKTLRALSEVRELGVLGIGIGGSEHEFPPEPFAALYEEARRLGLRTTAHAGEAAGPAGIWGALRTLGAERIGHATRAIEDHALVDHLVERRVPLELCPMSNVRTGVVRDMAAHPVREYFDRGCVVSVSTDDPHMFGTTLAGEYRALEETFGFTRREICRLVLLAIESSWLPEARKNTMAAEFARSAAWA